MGRSWNDAIWRHAGCQKDNNRYMKYLDLTADFHDNDESDSHEKASTSLTKLSFYVK